MRTEGDLRSDYDHINEMLNAAREAGIKIIVTADAQFGTIGASKLVFGAVGRVRSMLYNMFFEFAPLQQWWKQISKHIVISD